MSRDVCEHFTPVDLPCAKCEKPPTLRDDIIKMAREAGFVVDEVSQRHQPNCIFHTWHMIDEGLTRFAALVAAAEREILADWMRQHGLSTGQAYTTESLLDRLGTEMVENTDAAVLAEREECAKVALSIDDQESVNQRSMQKRIVRAIRARGNT